MTDKWLEISVQVDSESVDAVSEMFRRHVHGGVSIEQEIEAVSDDGAYIFKPDSPILVKGYVPLDTGTEEKVQRLEEGLWHLSMLGSVCPMSQRVVDEDDWKDAWKEFFHVHRVGQRVVIKPTWRSYEPKSGDIIVEIDPGMAFGTGLHPTTQMCLAEIENYVRPAQTILDLGTGSGILSIAAARLGAKSILALDVDSVAVSAARSNVLANGLQGIIRVEQNTLQFPPDVMPAPISELAPADGFDIIVANIIAQVISDLAPSLAAATKSGGHLIASGIILDKAQQVLVSLKAAGLEIAAEDHLGDWVTVVARKPASSAPPSSSLFHPSHKGGKDGERNRASNY